MFDDALLGKLGFGVLVLVLCGVLVATRKERPVAVAAPAPAVHAAPATAPPPPPAPPVDLQEVQVVPEDAPPNVETVLAGEHPHRARPRAVLPPERVRMTHFVPPRIHRIVATRRASARSGPHYPFDPRQRWASRELP